MSTGRSVGARVQDQEIKILKEKIEHLKKSQVYTTPELANTKPVEIPFSDAVIEIDFPDCFRAPIINKYDGSANPKDHLTTIE